MISEIEAPRDKEPVALGLFLTPPYFWTSFDHIVVLKVPYFWASFHHILTLKVP